MSSVIADGARRQLSQNPSTSAAISRAISTFDGAFSSRDMVGCEHKGSPLSGAWHTAILKIGSTGSALRAVRPFQPSHHAVRSTPPRQRLKVKGRAPVLQFSV